MTLLLLALAGNCFAQPFTWQDVSGTSGYQLLLQSGPGNLIATNHRGVVYQSTDEGASFNSILAYPSATGILELAVNVDHAAVRIFDPLVSGHYQIIRWNGAPNDWTRIFASSFSFYQKLMLNDSGVVFAIDPFNTGKIVRYSDGSWIPIGSRQSWLIGSFGTDLNVITAIDHSNNIIVGSGAGGVYVSGDAGQSWARTLLSYPVSAVNVTLANTILIGARPSPSPPLNTFGGVFVSNDSGRSWKGLGLQNHLISSIAVRESGSIYALADGDAYKRDDASGEWAVVSPSGRQFTSLVVSGPDTIIVMSEASGKFESTDDGVTWVGADIRGRDIFSLGTLPSGELFAGTLGSGVFKSVTGGAGWTQLPAASTGEYIYSFAVGGDALYAGTNRGVTRTTDQGASWQYLSAGAVSGSAYAVAVLPGGALFAGTGFGVYRSADSGVTWVSSGLTGSKVFFLAAGADGLLYAGTDGDGIYRSTDGGASWVSVGLVRNDLQTLVLNSSGEVFAGVYGGVVRSTDQGATWRMLGFGTGYVYSLLPAGSQTLIAGTHTGLYFSSDAGDSWAAAGDSGLGQNFVLSLALDGESHVLTGTYRGTVYRSLQQLIAPTVSAVGAPQAVPRDAELLQNYPNPFNPRTGISFRVGPVSTAGGGTVSLAEGAFVTLRVYDLSGREVADLINERKSPGVYTVYWDASDRPSGAYFYRLRIASVSPGSRQLFQSSKKMLLVR